MERIAVDTPENITIKSKNPEKDNKKWEWHEPSEDEFEERRKSEIFYRLYSVVNDDIGEVILYKFWAKNDEEALKILEEYKAENEYQREIFYSTSGYHIGSDGKRYDSTKQIVKSWCHKKGFFEKIWDFFIYRFCGWFRDGWYHFKDTMSFNRKGHSDNEWWSLDYHMLDDLKFNLPILAKKHIGVPTFMCSRACEKLGKEVPNDGDYGKEATELASKMWTEELLGLLENVLLYQYYEGYGHFDEKKDPQMVEIDKKFRNTLPYKPGTNHEFDYAKLNELTQDRWNAIWDWIKEYGQALWD